MGAALGSGLTGLLLTSLAAIVLAHRDRVDALTDPADRDDARSHPHRRFGWALAGIGWFWGLTGLAEAWVRLAVVTDEALPGSTLAAWLFYRGGSFLPATVALLALLFPTGRFLPGGWGVAGRISLGLMVLNSAIFVLVPDVGSREIGPPDRRRPRSLHDRRPGADGRGAHRRARAAVDRGVRRAAADRGGAPPPLPRCRA